MRLAKKPFEHECYDGIWSQSFSLLLPEFPEEKGGGMLFSDRSSQWNRDDIVIFFLPSSIVGTIRYSFT